MGSEATAEDGLNFVTPFGLIFTTLYNAGSSESVRGAFADYARGGESVEELRARVNRTILEDLEERVLALRMLHQKLRDLDAGESFGDLVARGRPV